jgi:hypothetical protein
MSLILSGVTHTITIDIFPLTHAKMNIFSFVCRSLYIFQFSNFSIFLNLISEGYQLTDYPQASFFFKIIICLFLSRFEIFFLNFSEKTNS